MRASPLDLAQRLSWIGSQGPRQFAIPRPHSEEPSLLTDDYRDRVGLGTRLIMRGVA